MQLRQYRPDDFSRLVEIENLSFSAAHRFSEEELQGYLSRGFNIVAEVKGIAVGFVIVDSKDGKHPLIATIEVHPEFQRRGIGTRLLHAVETCCREAGCQEMTLFVSTENPGALALYRRAGYEITKREDNFYRDGMAAFGMSKLLSSLSTNSQSSRA